MFFNVKVKRNKIIEIFSISLSLIWCSTLFVLTNCYISNLIVCNLFAASFYDLKNIFPPNQTENLLQIIFSYLNFKENIYKIKWSARFDFDKNILNKFFC